MNNKEVVEKYIQGFRETNHEKILACLDDEVIWHMPGFINAKGKAAFDKEIENDAFEGRPSISITRLTEEKNIVVAEGAVQCRLKNGNLVDAVFCDVFELKDSKIIKLTTYQMDKK